MAVVLRRLAWSNGERRRLIARDPYVWSSSDLPGSSENNRRRLDIQQTRHTSLLAVPDQDFASIQGKAAIISTPINALQCIACHQIESVEDLYVFPSVFIYNVWKEWVNALKHQKDRQTDRQMNMQTERQTDNRFLHTTLNTIPIQTRPE